MTTTRNLLALLLLLSACAAPAAVTTLIERRAGSFDRAQLAPPGNVAKIRAANDLAGVSGWFEYDVNVTGEGWYELVVNGHAVSTEVFIDPRGDEPQAARYYVASSNGYDGREDKIGNFWLPAGRHVIRLQRWYWTGFPAMTGFSLRSSDGRLATSIRVHRRDAHGVFRKGECGELSIEYGPRSTRAALPLQWLNALTQKPIRSWTVELPATPRLTRLPLKLPCDDDGTFKLYFAGDREGVRQRDVHEYAYEVYDTAAPPAAGPLRRTLVQEIDLTRTEPDYRSGDTRVVTRGEATYRISGERGWLDFQRAPVKLGPPHWFAYVLKNVVPQQPHVVEIDYPDDESRTFAIALRESDPLSYPVAGGVDSGGDHPPSQRMLTHSLQYWPRARGTRLTFLPAHDGRPAAAARVRVYRLDGTAPPLVPPAVRGRQFANWYEEGSNFLSMYGAPDEGPVGSRIALQRWAQAIAAQGGDTLWPTVAIYSFALYPSRYQLSFGQPWSHDVLRQALYTAEQHGLGVIPELHPRADELSWPHAAAPAPKPHLLASRTGQNHPDLPPFHNPLHPDNQRWYLGMIGELADRYRDSPALRGVSLRFMQWKNPTLHNFHSLDWGYDDYTIAQFEKDTGIRVAVDRREADRHAARHQWLMTKQRAAWIAWRSRRIAELLTRVRDRVRQARADLVVYVPVFAMTEQGSTYNSGEHWLREAGLDPDLLGRIDGVVLVNAMHTYGRRGDERTHTLLRQYLVDRSRLLALGAAQRAFLSTANYFEATELVAPPVELGFPAHTKQTWMSAVVNPAGRGYLERYARVLAETDARLLGDGGNAYTLGQPELREFLADYRRLPAQPFTRRDDQRGPAAVWDLAAGGQYYVYAVNRTGQPVTVTLRLAGTGTLTRLADPARTLAVSGQSVDIRLAPFELQAFVGAARLRLETVATR